MTILLIFLYALIGTKKPNPNTFQTSDVELPSPKIET